VRAPDDGEKCERVKEILKKNTGKDSLHPPMPLYYWLRAHPAPAATDDITV